MSLQMPNGCWGIGSELMQRFIQTYDELVEEFEKYMESKEDELEVS